MSALFALLFATAAHADATLEVTPYDEYETIPVTPMHGLRLGYVLAPQDEDSEYSSHNFALGYEGQQIVDSGGRVDVLFVENIMAAGINQGLFIPSANAMVGFHAFDRFQIGCGVNFNVGELLSDDGHAIGMVAAAGILTKMGRLNVPLHVSVIPQRGDVPRAAVTTGVNW